MSMLSEVQVEILAALANGATGEQASRRLAMSERSVRRQEARIREQLGVNTITQALVWAVRQGLI